eukprot:scaffold44370_cov82-Phaeocystis_antarctica.AAC.1
MLPQRSCTWHSAAACDVGGPRSEEGLCAFCECQNREEAEGANEHEQYEEVDPPAVGVDVVVVDDGVGRGSGRRVPPLGGALAELVEDEKVHPVLEAAEVLHPVEPHWDLRGADEEASEEQLRHEQCRRRLLRHLGIGHKAAYEQRGGGGSEAGDPIDEDEDEPRAVEGHQPVGDEVDETRDDEEGGQLDERLGEEVRHRAVGGGGVLTQEDASVEREAQQERLRATENAADGDLRHAAKVRHGLVGVERRVAHLEEDERKEEVEHRRHQKLRDEARFVAPEPLQLPLRKLHRLHGEARRRLVRHRQALVCGQAGAGGISNSGEAGAQLCNLLIRLALDDEER